MAQIARLVHDGLDHRADAVDQHASAVAVDQPERQAGGGVLARRHAVEPVVGEEIGPRLELAVVEDAGVFGVELLDLEPELAELGRRRPVAAGHRSIAHCSSITSR